MDSWQEHGHELDVTVMDAYSTVDELIERDIISRPNCIVTATDEFTCGKLDSERSNIYIKNKPEKFYNVKILNADEKLFQAHYIARSKMLRKNNFEKPAYKMDHPAMAGEWRLDTSPKRAIVFEHILPQSMDQKLGAYCPLCLPDSVCTPAIIIRPRRLIEFEDVDSVLRQPCESSVLEPSKVATESTKTYRRIEFD